MVNIECFHSSGQHICKFIGTKESVCIRKEFNSQRTGLGHQHGHRFIVLGHQYGRRDVMWKYSTLMRSAVKPLLKIWTNNIATFSKWFRSRGLVTPGKIFWRGVANNTPSMGGMCLLDGIAHSNLSVTTGKSLSHFNNPCSVSLTCHFATCSNNWPGPLKFCHSHSQKKKAK